MRTKRRKVWVTFDGYGLGAAYANKMAATTRVRWSSRLKDPNEREVAVPMVELRSGDVVLSRESRNEIRHVLDLIKGAPDSSTKNVLIENGFRRIRALLRGGR